MSYIRALEEAYGKAVEVDEWQDDCGFWNETIEGVDWDRFVVELAQRGWVMRRAGENRVLLSARDVAERCGVTSITVHRWADSGRLPCVIVGKVGRVFCEEDVERFVADREARA